MASSVRPDSSGRPRGSKKDEEMARAEENERVQVAQLALDEETANGGFETNQYDEVNDDLEKTHPPREVYVMFRIQRIGDLDSQSNSYRVHMYWRLWWKPSVVKNEMQR